MGVTDQAEERWQSYDPNGEPGERVLTKPEARSGILHGAAHVWIVRTGAHGVEVLLQRRAADKSTWPNHLDISAAGHVDFGETPLAAAVREAREEVGLELDAARLRLLFVRHARLAYGEIIEDEFQWVYGCELSRGAEFTFADGEVAAVSWMTLGDFRKLTEGGQAEYPLVPHGDAYFANLLTELARLIDT